MEMEMQGFRQLVTALDLAKLPENLRDLFDRRREQELRGGLPGRAVVAHIERGIGSTCESPLRIIQVR